MDDRLTPATHALTGAAPVRGRGAAGTRRAVPVIVFDSSGTALQEVAAAAAVYRRSPGIEA